MKKLFVRAIKTTLNLLEKRAEKKANAECIGFMYEPKIPKKLKKTISMGLACILAIGGILVGSVDTYEAVDYEYADWNILVTSPGSTDFEENVSLYISDRYYEWGVISASASNGYAEVILTSDNCKITMENGYSNVMTTTGAKRFKISNIDTSSSYYAEFNIELDFETYVTHFTGYVKIVK